MKELQNLSTQSRARALKNLLTRKEMSFLMEVHSGMSAKIAEEAGFEGLWGSGLSISAACGVRDNNELSWTQVLDILEYITDATHIPLLLDGDTGYGNFNNMRRLVRKLETRQVAGVCIEDKLFPKTNSFIDGDAQPLADIEEFCGKIKAGKDAQSDDDFCIVARVEAFIAGWGLAEAIKRGEAYRRAGADAILIHSALSKPDEVLAFKKEWADRCPVVIVPTKYYSTPTEVFQRAGFSTIIWANHLLRSSVTAMQETAKHLKQHQSLMNIEEKVITVSEVFRLQGAEELKQAEKKYLPAPDKVSALILAASRGRELGELTEDRPKAMIKIGEKSILERICLTLNEVGINKISVVRGYRKEAVQLKGISCQFVDNDQFAETQEVYSLALGCKQQKGPLLVSYGDVLYQKYIPLSMLDVDADVVLAVSPQWQSSQNENRYADYVQCTEAFDAIQFNTQTSLKKIIPQAKDVQGEWIGLMMISQSGLDYLNAQFKEWQGTDVLKKMRMSELINKLVENGRKVKVVYTNGHWLDVDQVKDVIRAGDFAQMTGGRA